MTDLEMERIDRNNKRIENLEFQLRLGLTVTDNLMVAIENLVPKPEDVPEAYRNAVYWSGDADELIKG